MSLSANLKIRRTEIKMTQKELAEKVGVEPATISKYESGMNEPNIKTPKSIAEALDTSIDELVKDEEDVAPILFDCISKLEYRGYDSAGIAVRNKTEKIEIVKAIIIIAIIASYVLNRTRIGLSLRSVGENPATADAAGINVDKYKYLATCIGGIISGMGGLYYVMDFAAANWQNNILDQFGWLAVALVIFAVWKPNIAIMGSVVFGALYVIGPFLPNLTNKDQELIKLVPYLVTIVVLVIVSIRNKKENQPPESLGIAYFREER